MSTHDTLSLARTMLAVISPDLRLSRGQDGSWEVLRNGFHYRNTGSITTLWMAMASHHDPHWADRFCNALRSEDIRADIVRLQDLQESSELLSELGRSVRSSEIQDIRERLKRRMEGSA